MVDVVLYFVVGFVLSLYNAFRLMLFDKKMHPKKYENSDNYLMTLFMEDEDFSMLFILIIIFGTALWPITFTLFTIFDITWATSVFITKKIKEKEANTDVSQSTRGDKG